MAPPSKASVAAELLTVVALAAGFLALFRGRPGYVDVTLAVVAVGLILASTRRSREIWRRARPPLAAPGSGRGAAWVAMLVFTGAAVAAFLAIGLYRGHVADGWSGAFDRVANWHLIIAAALYLPWALLQQFVFQFYLLGRLLWLLPPAVAVVLTAAAFSAVHFPRAPVMLVTAFAGAIWAMGYCRYRRLLPLAASHAVLGTTLHYWVFGRDLAVLWGVS